MNDDEKLELAQDLINDLSPGDKFSLKELFREFWDSIPDKKEFGKQFKRAVNSNKLSHIIHVGIRESGRCD